MMRNQSNAIDQWLTICTVRNQILRVIRQIYVKYKKVQSVLMDRLCDEF